MFKKHLGTVLIVACALITLMALFAFNLHRPIASAARKQEPQRKQILALPGVLPRVTTDVAGVDATAAEMEGNWFVKVRVTNNTDVGIEYLRISGIDPSQIIPGKKTIDYESTSVDVREGRQPDGSAYAYHPEHPLIPSHGTFDITVDGRYISSAGSLTITGIAFADGRIEGRFAGEVDLQRAQIANRHGHPEDLQRLNQRIP